MTYRLIGGNICRQDVPGGDWQELSKDDANRLLEGVGRVGAAGRVSRVTDERLAAIIAYVDMMGPNCMPAMDGTDAGSMARELQSLRALSPNSEGEADFYAVWSGTMHIGTWTDAGHAEQASEEIEGSTAKYQANRAWMRAALTAALRSDQK